MPPRHSRRSPLLIGAVVSLLLVTCASIALLLTISKRRPVDDADVARLIEEIRANERRGGAAAGSRPTAPVEEPHGERQRAIEEATRRLPYRRTAAPREIPVWAVGPAVWTTPYPEGGRINPPLPPVKLLPEMLDLLVPYLDAGVETDPARQ